MGKSSPPDPPDPKETAAAQTGQNVDTAIANAYLGNVNQVTPYGSLTYEPTGSYQMADPQDSSIVRSIPTFTATQTLSDGQQAILDEQQRAQLGLAGAATTAARNVQGALDTQMSLDDLPNAGTYDVGQQPQLTQFDFNNQPQLALPDLNGGPQLRLFDDANTPQLTQFDPSRQAQLTQYDASRAPTLQTSFATQQGPGAVGNIGTVGNINTNANIGRVNTDLNIGRISTSSGASSGASSGGASGGGASGGGVTVSANRSELGPIKSVFDGTQRGVQYDFGQASDIPMESGAQSITEMLDGLNIDFEPTDELGEIQNTYNGDFSEERQRVEDALMQRMDPYLSQDREALEARLASQGLRYGSEAYQDAFGDFTRQSNDARLAAILNAGQEQSRLVGLERDRAQFFNAAQNQDAQQILARDGLDLQGQIANGTLQMNAATTQNASDLADARYTLDAQQQEYNQLRDRADFANAAQSQDFGQQYARGQFFNAAQAQGAAQTLEQDAQALRAGISNASGARATASAAASRDMQAQLANQKAALQEAQLRLDAQSANQQAALQEALFGLNAQGQQFNQAQAAAQFYNDASQQDYNNYLTGLGVGNATQQQGFDNYMTGLGVDNSIQQQGFENYQNGLDSYNSAAQQNFVNDQANIAAYNQSQQQDFMNYQAGLNSFNNTAQQDYQNYLTGLDVQNANRNQALQEQFALTNQPINQATALMGATQVQNPNLINPNVSQMPTTDFAGIQAENFQQQMNAYNAQMSNWNSLWGGLLGAGGQIGAAALG